MLFASSKLAFPNQRHLKSSSPQMPMEDMEIIYAIPASLMIS